MMEAAIAAHRSAALHGQGVRPAPSSMEQRGSTRRRTLAAGATLGVDRHAAEPPASGREAPFSWPSAAARYAALSTVCPEHAEGVVASVTGRLPEWLNGVYLRNGPGSFECGAPGGMVHWFDGYALLVRLECDGAANAVTASHSFVESEAYKRFKSTGRMAWREFATPVPHKGLLGKIAGLVDTVLGVMGFSQGATDNACVNVIPQAGGEVWAVTETVPGTIAVDPATLRTLGRVRFADSIRGALTTAHPKLLPNGDYINILSVPGEGFKMYRQRRLDGHPPKRELVATIPHRHPAAPAWVHDMAASRSHVVLIEAPLYFNLAAIVLGYETDHLFMDWRPEEGTQVHAVRLADGHVHTFTAPPRFAFHWANAFESGDGQFLHVEGAVFDDAEIVSHLKLKNIRAGPGAAPGLPPSGLRRLTLDLWAPQGSAVAGGWEGLVDDESVHGGFIEFPCVAPSRRGAAHRFVWAACAARPTNFLNALAKVDTQHRRCLVWHEAGTAVGEPLFVPAPGAVEEDDGVVLAVLVQADGSAALLVLDGRSHKEVARAALPYALPMGFHGVFMSEP